MKSSSTSQLFSLLLLFLMIVGAVFFVMPMRDSIAVLSTQRTTSVDALTALQTEYDSLSALASEVSQSESAKESLLKAVPSGYGEDTLITDLSGMAQEAGFELNAMTFGVDVDEQLGKTISVTANLTGSYDQLVDFLQSVEAAPRLMRVTTLNVQRTSASAVAFNVQIEAFYQ